MGQEKEKAELFHEQLIQILEPENFPGTPMDQLEHQIVVRPINDKFHLCYFFGDNNPTIMIPIHTNSSAADEVYWRMAEALIAHFESWHQDLIKDASDGILRILSSPTNESEQDKLKKASNEAKDMYHMAGRIKVMAMAIRALLKKKNGF